MNRIKNLFWSLAILKDTKGQDLIEYALMAGFVAVAAGAIAMFRRLATVLPRLDLATSGPGWGGSSFPRLDEIAIDGGVVLFAVVVATACGLVVGLGAAWRGRAPASAARASGWSSCRWPRR